MKLMKLLFCVVWLLVIAIASSTYAITPPDFSEYAQGEYWRNQALNDLIPFWEPTVDQTGGGYYTDVAVDGTVGTNSRKYPRMVSCTVYSFCVAYLLSGDEKYLQLAKHGLEYLYSSGWDAQYGGWFTELNGANSPTSRNKELFDQDYGNLGPVFYYFVTGDTKALSYAERTHRLSKEKAWDSTYQGYYVGVNEDWSTGWTDKSFNSQIDTATAYLIYLYLGTRKPELLEDLKTIGDVAVTYMFDAENQVIRERYSQNWSYISSYIGDAEQVEIGHNLKTAWVLLRLYLLTGETKYLECARKIGGKMLNTAWDTQHWGWYYTENAKKAAQGDYETQKCWWTQTEGSFMLLSLFRVTQNPVYIKYYLENAHFWNHCQLDLRYHEVYAYLKANGTPLTRLKGDLYKSGYHSMEHALMNYLYLQLYVNRKPVTLYFNLSSTEEGTAHYVRPVEDASVKIDSVEINGNEWPKFDAQAGCVYLPQGEQMKVKVVLSREKQ